MHQWIRRIKVIASGECSSSVNMGGGRSAIASPSRGHSPAGGDRRHFGHARSRAPQCFPRHTHELEKTVPVSLAECDGGWSCMSIVVVTANPK